MIQNILTAQTYIPTVVKGRTWDITKPHGMGSYSYYSIRLACDTIINSNLYMKVFFSNGKKIHVREDITNHKIYRYNSELGTEKLLIDYDLEIGSTFNNMEVDTIYYIYKYGEVRKVIHFNNPIEWIEGLGTNFDGIADSINGYSYVTKVYDSDTSCNNSPNNGNDIPPLVVKQIGSNLYFTCSSEFQVMIRVISTFGQLIDQIFFVNKYSINLNSYPIQMFILDITSERINRRMRVSNF